MEALCDPASSFESSYISCGGSGRNAFATEIFSSIISGFGMPTTAALTGSESE